MEYFVIVSLPGKPGCKSLTPRPSSAGEQAGVVDFGALVVRGNRDLFWWSPSPLPTLYCTYYVVLWM